MVVSTLVQEKLITRSGLRQSILPPAKHRNLKRVIAPLVVALLMLPAAYATKMFPLSIEQLTSKANLVLHGNVASTSVQRDPEGRIYTRVELQVAEAWKGQTKAKSFTLVQSGGVLGEEISAVDGQEDFSVGEEVVVFLVLNQRSEGVVIGLSQGKFKVKSEAGGEKVVHNLFHGARLTTELVPNANAGPQRLTLAELKRRVQGGRP
jgi:hypothetical protein